MKYKFIKGWKRWNAGDVIKEYEYKRIPVNLRHLLEPAPEDSVENIQRKEPEITTIEIPVPKVKNVMEGTAADKLSSYDPELPIEPTDMTLKSVDNDTKQKKNRKF